MFRTHSARGKQRFLDLNQKFKNKKPFSIRLNHDQLKLLEETELLSLAEKVETLCLVTGHKLSTEIFEKINYELNQEFTLVANEKNIANIRQILEQLPFKYFITSKQIIDQKTGQNKVNVWFQVSANKAVDYFFKKYPEDLTEFEEGVIYGFPVSAISAFAGLIEKAENQVDNVWNYFLAGVGSKDFLLEEDIFYHQVWLEIGKISPKIVKQAELFYENRLMTDSECRKPKTEDRMTDDGLSSCLPFRSLGEEGSEAKRNRRICVLK